MAKILKGTKSIYNEIKILQRQWENRLLPEYMINERIFSIAKKLYYLIKNKYGSYHPVAEYLRKRYKFEKFFSIYKPISEKDLYELSRLLEESNETYRQDDINKFLIEQNMKRKPSPVLLALPLYLTTIGSVVLFHYYNIPMYNLVFVVVATVLFITLTAMFVLRNNDQTSEENFMEIIKHILKVIPGLNWFLKK